MPSVYLETTIISYLAADPSRDLIVAAHQQITHDWWKNYRQQFDLCISQLVVDEMSQGNARIAKRRLELAQDIPLLALSPQILALAKSFITKGPLPKNAEDDALHIALAAFHGVDYLLTWNCKHIANLFIQRDLEKIILRFGLRLPQIGNPEALKGA